MSEPGTEPASEGTSGAHHGGQGGQRWRRPDASMTLLREAMERPLDPGYAAAAARRGQESPSGLHRTLRAVVVFVLAVLIGLGGVWAAKQLRAPSPEGGSVRATLIEQIRDRNGIGADLAATNATLRSEVQALQEAALGEDSGPLLDEARALAAWAGSVAVTGPGLRLTMHDSTRAQAGEPNTEEERVTDFDLQTTVNALWGSGAEAIAINGVRLTSATAIRSASSTVLVDLQPMVSPYVIEVIGDAESIRIEFAGTAAAGHLSALSARYGIASELQVADELSLPAGTVASGSLTIISD